MDKVAVITGASKGIGASTAIAFAKVGYDVVVNYRSEDESVAKVVSEIEALGRSVIKVKADVFDDAGISQLVKTVKGNFKTIDVLVNNVGDPTEPEFGEYTRESVLGSLSGNFVSAVLCTQELVPVMNKGGCVLFTGSIYGLNFAGNPVKPLYSVGKAALINFAQSLAEMLAPDIRCNVVAPGHTLTPFRQKGDPEYNIRSLQMNLQSEWIASEEIANAFVFLAETPHIDAQTIVIDSGWQKKIRDDFRSGKA